MRDINFWTITGNLTKDPLLNHLDDGLSVCHFRLAISARREDGQPSYVDVTVWRREAENCATYLKKGSRVFVGGPLQATLATLKDGRTVLDLAVDARCVEFMGGPVPKKDEEPREPEPVARPPRATVASRR